jgi:hypothetical protein
MKITNSIQNCEINKENPKFQNKKGYWAGPTRQRGPARGLLRLPPAPASDRRDPLVRERGTEKEEP